LKDEDIDITDLEEHSSISRITLPFAPNVKLAYFEINTVVSGGNNIILAD
jgi:hypothetical protein